MVVSAPTASPQPARPRWTTRIVDRCCVKLLICLLIECALCSPKYVTWSSLTPLLFSLLLLLSLFHSTNMYCQPFYHHRDFAVDKQQVHSLSPTDPLTNAPLPHHTLSPPPSPCHSLSHFNGDQLVYNKQQQLSTSDAAIRFDTSDLHCNQRWSNQAEMSNFSWPTHHYGSYSNQMCPPESNQNVIAAPSAATSSTSINGTEDISDADSSDVASFASHFRDRVARNFNDSSNGTTKHLDGYSYSTIANENVVAPNTKSSLFCLMSQSIEDDEDARRRRRRERNKLAASKCRFKKRQHVAFLMSESERLESSNSTLKLTLNELQSELEQLAQVLHSHKCHFVKQNILQLSNIITPLHQA